MESNMRNLVSRFVKDESGATAIEYGLIAVLIGVAIIAGATALGGALDDTFQGLADYDFLFASRHFYR